MRNAGSGRAHHRSVDRVASILETVVRVPGGATLSELARRLDAPVSSLQKLVNGLVAVGYLSETGRRYTLGPAPYVLSLRAGRTPLHAVRHADLASLSTEVAAPVLLAVRVGEDAVYVDWAGADEPFDFALSDRVRGSLLDTAAGRVLLAHLPEAQRRAVVVAARPDDPAAVVEVLAEAEVVRRAGEVRGASGPLLPDAAAVAVPVREGGTVVAAVAVTTPADAPAVRLALVATALREAAQRWSARP